MNTEEFCVSGQAALTNSLAYSKSTFRPKVVFINTSSTITALRRHAVCSRSKTLAYDTPGSTRLPLLSASPGSAWCTHAWRSSVVSRPTSALSWCDGQIRGENGRRKRKTEPFGWDFGSFAGSPCYRIFPRICLNIDGFGKILQRLQHISAEKLTLKN